jgi:hypothetical protein
MGGGLTAARAPGRRRGPSQGCRTAKGCPPLLAATTRFPVPTISPARLAASSSGQLLAAADAAHQVLLMALAPHKGTSHLKWEFVGKFKAHRGEAGRACRRRAPFLSRSCGVRRRPQGGPRHHARWLR